MNVSMTNYDNRKILNDALEIYFVSMREFIIRGLKVVSGEKPEDLIAYSLTHRQWEQFDRRIQQNSEEVADAIDITYLPRIINDNDCWELAFKDRFDPNREVRSVVRLIGEARNRVAHREDIPLEDTKVYLFYIAKMLGYIKASDEKQKQIEDLQDKLPDSKTEHLKRAEAEKVELKKCLEEAEADKVKLEKHLIAEEAEKTKLKGYLDMEKSGRTELKEHLSAVKMDKDRFEKRLTDKSNLLKSVEAENVDLKKRILEKENRLKTVESESAERIKTLTERLRTVEAGQTILEERPKNSPIEEWRRKIWKQLCDYAAQKDTPVRFQKPGSAHYLNVSRSLIDLTGFNMNVWLGRDNREIAIRLYMSKQNFYTLKKQRKEIAQEFCESFEWEKLPQRRESRISLRKGIIDPTDELDWQNQYEWVISKLEKFHKKFNEVFLPRIQELNTSDSLSENAEYLPLNPATPNSVTFQGTPFTKRLNKYRVEGDEITQTFWHYWHSQGHEGKQEMRDAGWRVEKVNGDWEVTISPEDFEAWIVYTESQSYSESSAKSSKSQRKWRRHGAVAALRDPTEIQEAEAKIAKILNPSEKARLERELREAKRAVDGS